MKRALFLAALALAVMGTGSGTKPVTAASAAAAATAHQRWEYAYLNPSSGVTVWASPGVHVANESAFAVYEKIGGKLAEKEFNAGYNGRVRALLDVAGDQGWELVAVSRDAQLGETYWLKRAI